MKDIYRAKRTRAKIHGTAERPRLTVHLVINILLRK